MWMGVLETALEGAIRKKVWFCVKGYYQYDCAMFMHHSDIYKGWVFTTI